MTLHSAYSIELLEACVANLQARQTFNPRRTRTLIDNLRNEIADLKPHADEERDDRARYMSAEHREKMITQFKLISGVTHDLIERIVDAKIAFCREYGGDPMQLGVPDEFDAELKAQLRQPRKVAEDRE